MAGSGTIIKPFGKSKNWMKFLMHEKNWRKEYLHSFSFCCANTIRSKNVDYVILSCFILLHSNLLTKCCTYTTDKVLYLYNPGCQSWKLVGKRAYGLYLWLSLIPDLSWCLCTHNQSSGVSVEILYSRSPSGCVTYGSLLKFITRLT